MTRLLTSTAAAVALALGVTLGGATVLPSGIAQAQSAEAETPQIAGMSIGAEDAPVTIVEYASFTCPHCADFHDGVFQRIKEDYVDTGKVRFEHREVYFDRYGLWASMVARCGGEQRYFGIVDMIYDQQSEWARGEPVQI